MSKKVNKSYANTIIIIGGETALRNLNLALKSIKVETSVCCLPTTADLHSGLSVNLDDVVPVNKSIPFLLKAPITKTIETKSGNSKYFDKPKNNYKK